MNFELKDFQKRATRELLQNTEKKEELIVLDAPTGAGKTIILIDFIDQFLDLQPETVVVWFTPGAGELEEQSEEKMKTHTKRTTRNIDEVITQGFNAGDTVFINWEKVAKKDAKALREGERKNLEERVQDAHRRGLTFILIIDEEHKNDTLKSKSVIDLFESPTQIRASATTTKSDRLHIVKVTESEAIAEGLLTKAIYINENLENAKGDTETEVLLQLAIEKQREIQDRYKREGKDINPMVLIQVPNRNDAIIHEVEEYLAKQGFTYGNKRVAKWLSDKADKINITEDDLGHPLTKNNAEPIFLIMKQAIATGWDAPRAKILVKLRENMSEQFSTQVIGRIRRMPEAHHYDDDTLDTCFLYTYDEDYVDGTKKSLGDLCKDVKIVHLKDDHKGFTLIKELKVESTKNIDGNKLLQLVKKGFKEAYRLEGDLEVNKKKFTDYGYDMGGIITNKTRTGLLKQEISADHIADLSQFNHEIEINQQRHAGDLKRSIAEIANKLNVKQSTMNSILKTLFSKSKGAVNRILDLPSKEYMSFIIVNEEKLKDIMSEIIEIAGVKTEVVEIDKEEIEFKFPLIENVPYKKQTIGSIGEHSKNVYRNYPSTATTASDCETLFERYCEKDNDVEFWYKNREDKNESFSVLYKDKIGTNRYFFPDYIIKTRDGKIWIIETKGGETKERQDKNIDKNAAEKFSYLKEYARKHGVEFGFVRDHDLNLYFKNDEYTDDMKTGWIELDKIF